MSTPDFGDKLGPYEVVRLLGKGGMAQAWLGQIRGADDFTREVVLKRILPEFASVPAFLAMFRDEAQITAQLRHGNIVQVLEFRHERGEYFLVLEYVDGKNLQTILKERRTLGFPVIAHIITEVARGLDYAHRKKGPDGQPLGIIHRDVSPSNVLVSNEGEVKLADFGIARAKSRLSDTQAGGVKGKLRYMAPEALRGKPEPRSDLFSLGCMAFELLVGFPPFEGDTDENVMYRLLNEDPPQVRWARPDAPPILVDLIDRLLRKNPDERPSRGSDVADVLYPFASAAQPPATEQLALVLTTPVVTRQAIPRSISAIDARAETILPEDLLKTPKPPPLTRSLSDLRQSPSQPSNAKCVAVLEQSQTTRALIRRAIAKDLDVKEVDGPAGLLDLLAKQKVDIVIAQHMLKGEISNGFQLIEALKLFDPRPGVILVVGDISDELRTKARELGVAVVAKANPSKLVEGIKEAIDAILHRPA